MLPSIAPSPATTSMCSALDYYRSDYGHVDVGSIADLDEHSIDFFSGRYCRGEVVGIDDDDLVEAFIMMWGAKLSRELLIDA